MGPSEFGPSNSDNAGVLGSINLNADAAKDGNTVTVASTAGFSPGQIVLLDEAFRGRLADRS